MYYQLSVSVVTTTQQTSYIFSKPVMVVYDSFDDILQELLFITLFICQICNV